MFLVASVLVPATALAASSGTMSLSPNTVSTTVGSTFTVTINSQASVPMSGASAGIDFDKTKLQIVSVTKGADWGASSASWVLPSVATIATANNSGHLPAIAAYFSDGTSSLPGTTAALAQVTFFATATGTPSLSLSSSGPDAASILDGTAATYGQPVPAAASGATVTITAGSGSNTSITASVTGSVDAGYFALTCPTSETVPLSRSAVSTVDFQCAVSSNVTWTMSTEDNNPDPNHGHMVDAGQAPVAVLADSLHVISGANNVDLMGAGLQAVATGQNNVSVPLTFSQNVRASDKPGSYGMSVLFSLTSTF
ncbi:MAG TPA: cohesin domain-containing protein [Mycobacterium sp.]|nr:cohesin domain-containing protein [Mycobacterium sp.]